MVLARKANEVASKMPGEPISMQWFSAWSEVLQNEGTDEEIKAATFSISLVKKLWDAGY